MNNSLVPSARSVRTCFAFACSLVLPDATWGRTHGQDGQVIGVRLWDRAGSWADVSDGTVRQAGPGRLWDQVEELWSRVADEGEPAARERYGMTVRPAGSTVWLDDPATPL